MNSLTICGVLTSKPDYKLINLSGEMVAVCNMAIRVKSEKSEETFRVTAWRDKADECAKNLKAGDRVLVRGPVSLRKFVNKAQQFCSNMEVLAQSIDYFNEVEDAETEAAPIEYTSEEIF